MTKTTNQKSKAKAKAKAVYNIVEQGQNKYWNRIGTAFVNQDGSYNVVLSAVPVDGKLHIRDYKPKAESAQA